ncbi:MAG: hypothetical protein V4787_11560 [Pseudomonadota bacterium]
MAIGFGLASLGFFTLLCLFFLSAVFGLFDPGLRGIAFMFLLSGLTSVFGVMSALHWIIGMLTP